MPCWVLKSVSACIGLSGVRVSMLGLKGVCTFLRGASVLGLRDERACYLYLGHVRTWKVLCTCVFMLSSALCAQTLGLGVCVGHAYRLLVCVSDLGSWVCLCCVGFRAP